MNRFGFFLCLSVAVASLVSCKAPVARQQPDVEVVGAWQVDSVITQFYPTDSVLRSYFSDSIRQEVSFGEDGIYRTVVWQDDSVYLDLKLRYVLSGDTLTYCMDNGKDDVLELVESCSDTTLVTKSIMLYTDHSAELNTVYYSRVD